MMTLEEAFKELDKLNDESLNEAKGYKIKTLFTGPYKDLADWSAEDDYEIDGVFNRLGLKELDRDDDKITLTGLPEKFKKLVSELDKVFKGKYYFDLKDGDVNESLNESEEKSLRVGFGWYEDLSKELSERFNVKFVKLPETVIGEKAFYNVYGTARALSKVKKEIEDRKAAAAQTQVKGYYFVKYN